MTLYTFVYIFINFFFSYSLFTLSLAGFYLLTHHKRPLINRLLIASNFLILFSSVIFLTDLIFYFVKIYFSEDEWDAFAGVNRMRGPFWYLFWLPVLIKGVFPQVLWFRKARQHISFAITLSLLFFVYEVYIIISPLWQPSTWLPAVWQFDYLRELVYLVLYSIIVFGIFFIGKIKLRQL